MKTSNIPMWLLRICSRPIFIYCTFKQNGFFNGLRSLFMFAYIDIHFWMIRNCKWYRNILHKKYAKCGEEGEMLFDLIVNYWDINVKDFLNKYPKFKQNFLEHFDEVKQTVIENHVKSGELKTEEEIREFSEQLKLENFI